MHVRTRLAARVAVVGLSLGAVALPLAATQAHAVTAGITLSAGTSSTAQGLANGQVITVTGTGFEATTDPTSPVIVSIVECSGEPSAAIPPECDITSGHIGGAATDASGNFTTSFTIHAGAIGNGFCPSKTATGKCYLIASDMNNPGGASTAQQQIYFAPVVTATPNTNIKTGQTLTITGYGFKKSSGAAVLECALTASPSAATCDTNNVQLPTTTANGTFTQKLKVRIGKFGTGSVKAGGQALVSATTYLNPSSTPPPPPNSGGATPITFSKTQPVAPTKTSIKATAKAHGKKVTVAGVIKAGSKPAAGLKVSVWERAKGKTWKKAGSAVSKKGGKFSFSEKHFKHAEQYKVAHAKQTVAKKVYAASSSKVLTVKG